MICAPSVGEEQDAIFEAVFTAVRYIYNGAQLKEGYFLSISLNKIIIICVAILNNEGNYINLFTNSYSKHNNWDWKRWK